MSQSLQFDLLLFYIFFINVKIIFQGQWWSDIYCVNAECRDIGKANKKFIISPNILHDRVLGFAFVSQVLSIRHKSIVVKFIYKAWKNTNTPQPKSMKKQQNVNQEFHSLSLLHDRIDKVASASKYRDYPSLRSI